MVIVILAIGGVLAVLAACVCGGVVLIVKPAIEGARREAEVNLVKTQIGILEAPLKYYRLHTGEYPTTEQGLGALRTAPTDLADPTEWRGPYLEKGIALDP